MSIWKSPIFRQCLATLGVTLNFSSLSLVMGFTTGLLDQLQRPDSLIPIDGTALSWIASLPSVSGLLGNILAVPSVSRYGRKTINLLSSMFMVIGWLCIYFTTSSTTLLICRFIKGLSLGLMVPFAPILIGEYTSPKHRGAFLITLSVGCAVTGLGIHQMALNLDWRLVSLICGGYSIVTSIVIALSPESPNWLISKGRYEEGTAVFLLLRGECNEELNELIEAHVEFVKSTRDSFGKLSMTRKLYNNLKYFTTKLLQKEFYKPVIIMFHMFLVAEWSGVNVFVSYADIIFRKVDLGSVGIPSIILIMGIIRLILVFATVLIIQKWNRRTIFFYSAGFNIIMLLLTAAYIYASEASIFPYDHPAVNVVLNTLLMSSYLLGTVPMGFVILGEIFPLEFKNLGGTLSMIFCAVFGFLSIKTFPGCEAQIGLYGAYCVCAVVMLYGVLVTWYTLPETKDRTLQDIEDEMRGRSRRRGQAHALASCDNGEDSRIK